MIGFSTGEMMPYYDKCPTCGASVGQICVECGNDIDADGCSCKGKKEDE